jgi:hypothetical protein
MPPNSRAMPKRDRRLDRDHAAAHARPRSSGCSAIDAEVEQHADRHEEQAEQDRAERLDVASSSCR